MSDTKDKSRQLKESNEEGTATAGDGIAKVLMYSADDNPLNNPEIVKQLIETMKGSESQLVEIMKALQKFDSRQKGILGRIFGECTVIPFNTAALISFSLVLFGILYSAFLGKYASSDVFLSVKDMWTIITPIITLCVGYLFGDKSNSGKKQKPTNSGTQQKQTTQA